jgi:hypothetical protein
MPSLTRESITNTRRVVIATAAVYCTIGLTNAIADYPEAQSLGASCAKVINSEAAAFSIYLNCEEKESNCVELPDLDMRPHSLSGSSKTPLTVEKLMAVYNAESEKSEISLTVDANSKCWLTEFTKKNIKKTITLVNNGKIFSQPFLTSPIPNGRILLSLGNTSKYSDAIRLCKEISPNCVVQNNPVQVSLREKWTGFRKWFGSFFQKKSLMDNHQ